MKYLYLHEKYRCIDIMREIELDLGDDLERFVKKQVESGRYESINELIIAALTNLEKKKSLEMLDKAILDGENSGPFEPFDFDEFLVEMNGKHVNNKD
jgi:antitoxin ParD1/3/4